MMSYYLTRNAVNPLIWLVLAELILIEQYNGQTTNPEGYDTQTTGGINDETTDIHQNETQASTIQVWIVLTPMVLKNGMIYVAANEALKIESKVTGFNESLLEYKWSTQEGVVQTDKNASAITYKFKKTNVDDFIQVDVLDPKTNSTGTSNLKVSVRQKLVVGDPIGKTFLEKGELVQLSMVYSGTPPFDYCYKFCGLHDLLPCNILPVCLSHFGSTSNTTLQIVQYLNRVDNYTLVFHIENIMNSEERNYAIRITGTINPKSHLPIEPMVSSILAVCIIVTGVALHMRFRDTSYNTETANFDFLHGNNDDDEDWEQELSLIQRVRYLFLRSNQDEDNETRYLIQNGTPNNLTNYYSRQQQQDGQQQQQPQQHDNSNQDSGSTLGDRR